MRHALIIAAALATVACTPQPPPTLDERLAGKTPEERREVLRVACLNEAEHLGDEKKEIRTVHGVKSDQSTVQTRRLKAICRAMDGENAIDNQK
ncbi:hypothetical protein [Tautonia sociabilis]|uniref:Uncharacterized protein n=1 Tax=Tautonia sociabilis TaxID=2080755 RepID=A0A432MR24_9BACT|nr:hypothetical protein [Tautonia sociabilis]RUL89475.1 hypothetical protein TsocGM_01500 [Tautonia sociabilis]